MHYNEDFTAVSKAGVALTTPPLSHTLVTKGISASEIIIPDLLWHEQRETRGPTPVHVPDVAVQSLNDIYTFCTYMSFHVLDVNSGG